MNIICLLSVRPSIATYQFFKSIKLGTQYDVYIVIDDNKYNIPDYDGIVKVIKINNSECEQSGFKSTVLWLDNKACSRDKALYYFTKESIDYKYIWFVEEDVFIPNIHTIPNIDKKYESEINYDLLVRDHAVINEKQTNWLWNHVNRQIKIDPPYACSMICAIRCSKAMLNSIKEYATAHKNLFLDEALFNTLVIHNKLNILCIEELSSIHHRNKWKKSDIVGKNLYHPIKNINTQVSYRPRPRPRPHPHPHPHPRDQPSINRVQRTRPIRPAISRAPRTRPATSSAPRTRPATSSAPRTRPAIIRVRRIRHVIGRVRRIRLKMRVARRTVR
jgi:hypothetical protein